MLMFLIKKQIKSNNLQKCLLFFTKAHITIKSALAEEKAGVMLHFESFTALETPGQHPYRVLRPRSSSQSSAESAHTNFPLHLITLLGQQAARTVSRTGNGIITGFKEKLPILPILYFAEVALQAAGIAAGAG